MSASAVFVGRDAQLASLGQALNEVVDGRGQVRFVVGEAGSGKTALVGEFARQAQVVHEDLIVAVGQSDAQTGVGDAYLPFREMLAQLTGDVDAKLAQGRISEENAGRLQRFLGHSGQAIVDLGPDLIGTLIPGAALATRVATYLAKKMGRFDGLEKLLERPEAPESDGIDQSHIFEQYTNVLNRLAQHQPLLLVLDDLQWADAASAGLLFRLGRTIGDSRILLVGTFRPAEVAIGRGGDRHPLEKVLAEFKRYFGDISMDLGEADATERRRLIDAMLDSEPNRLGDGFRQSLFERTAGHPLFTVELVRELVERGDLFTDEAGRWMQGPSLDWDTLPARVEGVIEERIGRLEDDLQEMLAVASVEGEDFTAEVVALVQSMEPRDVVRRLGHELEDRHRLVRSRGVRRLEVDGTRLSLYSFHHNLFQRYLYQKLDAAERAYLHQDVGTAIETLGRQRIDEFVVQLARHFNEAGITHKAATYLRRAGELAARRYANDEAANYLSQALQLTAEADSSARWEILCTLEEVHALQGVRDAQTADIAAMRSLSEDLDDDTKRAEVAIRTAALSYAVAAYQQTIIAAEEAILYAQTNRDVAREARAYIECGFALMEEGLHSDAHKKFELALALAEGAALHRIQARSLQGIARVHSERGEYAAAVAGFAEALRIYERLSNQRDANSALNNLAIVAALQGDHETAQRYFMEVLEGSKRIGDRDIENRALNNLGEVALECNDFSAARELYRESLRISLLTDDLSQECSTLSSLGDVELKLGLSREAEEHLRRSLDIATRIGQKSVVGSALARLAKLCLSTDDSAKALDNGTRAIEVARALCHRRLEGHALEIVGLSLERLGRLSDATAAYERSRAIMLTLGMPNAAIEAVAGLSRVSQSRGDLTTALSYVDDILDHVADSNLDRTRDPIAIYLTCFRVLDEAGDPRAAAVLTKAHEMLVEMENKISDPAIQRAFRAKDLPQEILGLTATSRV